MRRIMVVRSLEQGTWLKGGGIKCSLIVTHKCLLADLELAQVVCSQVCLQGFSRGSSGTYSSGINFSFSGCWQTIGIQKLAAWRWSLKIIRIFLALKNWFCCRMICRKLLMCPTAKVFFILDQISGLLNCWRKWNKQCSSSIFEKVSHSNLKIKMNTLKKKKKDFQEEVDCILEKERTQGLFSCPFSTRRILTLNSRIQVIQQPIQNALPCQLFSLWETVVVFGVFISPPHKKNLIFSVTNFNNLHPTIKEL